ncbi:hypothetical protein B0O80DRAFT_504572 [Mortierella sp. GBAus27b]|nr:Mismatch repair endonuclease pms2 [Mortierella sp. GBA43]KAI8345174.1 hypothetical protein B0O80DRAFT_504572 [Mortierella sp. GBAus27b]
MNCANNGIKQIGKDSVHRICSGQVILDMATAVKELIENSLDAGATSIAVRFKQHGLDQITVTDNGSGISDADLGNLALKHYTSKLRSFGDLEHVRSFGFRGEALSSLCAFATLVVTTSTGQSPMGVQVEYTSEGAVKSKTPTPTTKGTTVKVSNLFEGLPVRRGELVRNIKREYPKCLEIIQAYALITTNVRISCISQVDKRPPNTQISTIGNGSIRQNIINVFGPKDAANLVELNLIIRKDDSGLDASDDDDRQSDKDDDKSDEDVEGGGDSHRKQNGVVTLTGYISSPAFGKGRSAPDRQYIYINGRPCNLPSVTRAINEVYRSFNTNQSPFLVANLILPTSYYDVNVSPDKRTIFLHNEQALLEELRVKLTEFFEPTRSTFVIDEARYQPKKTVTPSLKPSLPKAQSPSPEPEPESETEEPEDNNVSDADKSEEEREEHKDDDQIRNMSRTPRKSLANPWKMNEAATATTTITGTSTTLTRLKQTTLSLKRKADDICCDTETENELTPAGTLNITVQSQESTSPLSGPSNARGMAGTEPSIMEGFDPLDDQHYHSDESPSSGEDDDEDVPTRQRQVRIIYDPEVYEEGDRDIAEVGFNMRDLRRIWTRRRKTTQRILSLQRERTTGRSKRMEDTTMDPKDQSDGSDAEDDNDERQHHNRSDEFDQLHTGVSDKGGRRSRNRNLVDASFYNKDNASAEKALKLTILKGDFERMDIIGQFNNAFIIAQLDRYAQDDHSIEDQKNSQSGPVAAHDEVKKVKRTHRGALIESHLYVIDQHACNERFFYETLMNKTVLHRQPLVLPMKIFLTAQEEILVEEYMDTLNMNGFYLKYDPEAPVSYRHKLTTIPVSEDYYFQLHDFHELVGKLSERPILRRRVDRDHSHSQHGNVRTVNLLEKVTRCSKMDALFASRACRRSVMIGHALDHKKMEKLVWQMGGEIEDPWNCAHGRPTIRHVIELTEFVRKELELGLDTDYSQIKDSTDGKWTAAFCPISIKRPQRHQGSLFRKFMAIPPARIRL